MKVGLTPPPQKKPTKKTTKTIRVNILKILFIFKILLKFYLEEIKEKR
jgi:hypothetical protein